jgi:predicted cupin superfamily sugar epimerase
MELAISCNLQAIRKLDRITKFNDLPNFANSVILSNLSMDPKSNKLISLLKLKPHPEGGFFKETYRSKGKITSKSKSRFPNRRNFSTAIYFLLLKGSVSKFHRIKSDEAWHFYLGGPLTILEIDSKGKMKKTILGRDLESGEKLQHIVPAGSWFGSYLDSSTEFALVGCTVAPGFDFKDFEMANQKVLLKKFPKYREEILQLS